MPTIYYQKSGGRYEAWYYCQDENRNYYQHDYEARQAIVKLIKFMGYAPSEYPQSKIIFVR